jgi:hypothetical protein
MFRFPKRAVEIFAFAMRALLFTTAEGKWQTKPQGKKNLDPKTIQQTQQHHPPTSTFSSP